MSEIDYLERKNATLEFENNLYRLILSHHDLLHLITKDTLLSNIRSKFLFLSDNIDLFLDGFYELSHEDLIELVSEMNDLLLECAEMMELLEYMLENEEENEE